MQAHAHYEDNSWSQWFGQIVQYPIHKIKESINYLVGDSWKIITQKEKFIFGELSERSLKSKDGVALTHFGLPFLKLRNFMFLSGDYAKELASWGDYEEQHPENHDPHSRDTFKRLEEFMGNKFLINMNGEEVKEERKVIVRHLPHHKAIAKMQQSLQDIDFNEDERSVNEIVNHACINTIAYAWFDVETVSPEFATLAEACEHSVFNANDRNFTINKWAMKKASDDILEQQQNEILKHTNVLTHLFNTRKPNDLKDLNPFAGLIVAGNINTTILSAILHISKNETIQKNLKEELKKLEDDLEIDDPYTVIKKLPYLNLIWLESLRFSAPAGPIARYSSQGGQLKEMTVPKGTFLFMSLRLLMHDERYWKSPEIFDPERDEHNMGSRNYRKLSSFPFLPFSEGKRMCPASFVFAEAMFKTAIVSIFKNRTLGLRAGAQPETILPSAIEARYKQKYYLESSEPLTCSGEEGLAITNCYRTYQKSMAPIVSKEDEDQEILYKRSGLNF